MNKNFRYFIETRDNAILNVNQVARNTYMLLSTTILFSAFTSFLSVNYSVGSMNSLIFFFVSFLLLILIEFFKNTVIALPLVYTFTGLLGYSSGPIIKSFLHIKNGEIILLFSLLTTGCSFLLLSLYVLMTKKNFEFLTGFIFIGLIVILSAMLFNIFFKITILYLIISTLIIILSCMTILYTTSNILHGTETSYISATITLYLQIYNIFISLLNIFGIISSKD